MSKITELTVWVLAGRTESGDDVGPFVFNFEPTDDEQLEILRETYPAEFEDLSEEELEDEASRWGCITMTSVEEIKVRTR